MIFYVANDEAGRRHLVGTQADARAINRDFEQIDIPTDKPNLMAFVQGLFDEIHDLRSTLSNVEVEGPDIDAAEIHEPAPPSIIAPPAGPREMTPIEIAEAVLNMEGRDLEGVLSSAIQQLGTLRMSGVELLRTRDPLFATDIRSRTALERGFGYLVLDGLAGPLVPEKRSWSA